MSEQQASSTATSETDQRGMDRRKFLLRTTAVTAGAWAAPSILTIDRAFGATGSPCVPECATTTDAATVKGVVELLGQVAIPIRANACLNDDDLGVGPVVLPGTLGSIEVGDASCECSAGVQVANADLLIGSTPVVAQALSATASCGCNGTEGSTEAYNVQVGSQTFSSTTYQKIDLPGGLGFVALNESPGTATGTPDEFTALHIVFNDPLGDKVDLKLASAKVTCA